MAAGGGSRLEQKFVAQGPVSFEGLLCLCAVGNDAFFIAFAANAEDTLFAVHVGEVETGEFADAKTSGVEQLQESAIALEQEAGAGGRFGELRLRSGGIRSLSFGAAITSDASQFVEKAVHFFGGEHRGDALGELGGGNEAGGIFLKHLFADAVAEKGAESGEFAGDRTFFETLIMQVTEEFADHQMGHLGDAGRPHSGGREVEQELMKIVGVLGDGARRRPTDGAEVLEISLNRLLHVLRSKSIATIIGTDAPRARS